MVYYFIWIMPIIIIWMISCEYEIFHMYFTALQVLSLSNSSAYLWLFLSAVIQFKVFMTRLRNDRRKLKAYTTGPCSCENWLTKPHPQNIFEKYCNENGKIKKKIMSGKNISLNTQSSWDVWSSACLENICTHFKLN